MLKQFIYSLALETMSKVKKAEKEVNREQEKVRIRVEEARKEIEQGARFPGMKRKSVS